MQCHFNPRFIGWSEENLADPEYTKNAYCQNEGTWCPPCPCTVACVHTVNLVCAEHRAYVEGYMAAAYNLMELADPENYEPEDFTQVFEILDRAVLIDNHYAEGTTWIQVAKGEATTFYHDPASPLLARQPAPSRPRS